MRTTGDKDALYKWLYSRNGLRDTVTVRTDSLFRVGATFSLLLADYKKKQPVNLVSFESFLPGCNWGKYVEGICERYEICVHWRRSQRA